MSHGSVAGRLVLAVARSHGDGTHADERRGQQIDEAEEAVKPAAAADTAGA